MTAQSRPGGRWFFVVFALATLLLAGAGSYLADGNPDGLESISRDGCTQSGDRLEGSCPAQHEREHALADTPLAGYAVGGDSGLTGIAGVVGVLATLAVATGLFRLLGRPRSRRPGSAGGGSR